MASFSPQSASPATDSATPLLLDAKNIYVSQLSDAVGPYILKTIEALYEEAAKEGSSKVLLRFQRKLRDIPVWNSGTVEEHATAVEHRYPYMSDLIAAAFVAFVKVMSSIKLREDVKPNIRLKLPTNGAFLHKACINVAKDFYSNPRMVETPGSYTGMRAAVEKSIRQMLPIKDILKAYLGNTVDEAHTVSPTLDDDDDDETDLVEAESPAMFDSPTAPAPQPLQPVPQPAPQPVQPVPQPVQPVQPGPIAQVTECETRTISLPAAEPCRAEPGAEPASTGSDDLFSDADDNETDWKK